MNVDWSEARSDGVKEVLLGLGWSNQVALVTRPASKTNLDHVYSNLVAFDVKTIDCELSDHYAVYWSLNMRKLCPQHKPMRNINVPLLRSKLENEN